MYYDNKGSTISLNFFFKYALEYIAVESFMKKNFFKNINFKNIKISWIFNRSLEHRYIGTGETVTDWLKTTIFT